MTDPTLTPDVVVIGGGPGGYVASIRAAQLGLSAVCVELDRTLGGTCVNVGCIPSKALLGSSEHFEFAHKHAAEHGIQLKGISLDLQRMMKRKDDVVAQNTKGVEFLFKKNKVTWAKGVGSLKAGNVVDVKALDGTVTSYTPKHVILATGSVPMALPFLPFDEERVLSNVGALRIPEVPRHLIVIGGGVIGLELGSVWRRLGSQVTVVEFLDRILPGMDNEVCRQCQRLFEKQGIVFKLSSKVTAVDGSGKVLKASVEPAAGGKAETIEADVVLVAIGRVPYTEGLGLEEIGAKKDNRGRVVVDEHFATGVPGIYAIGDVIAGPMLAHKAEDEGMAVAEIIAGQAGHVNYDVIPNVVYTFPEIASVGKTEEELKAAGTAYNTGKFPFTANGRAKANHQTDGFVKILADAKTDRVLGVHIVGADAGNMIAEAAVAMEFGASSEDIARTCHAHPTLPEAVKEAALAVAKRAIHM
jgi:dihydrolipoamide dehydrogenase